LTRSAPAPRLYTVHVLLAHVIRDKGIVPETSAHVLAPNVDWRPLVITNPGALAVWSVERTNITRARDMVLAHLAGHAPAGVMQLWDKKWPIPDNATPDHWAKS